MNGYKSLMIGCMGLLATASSLAAWGYGNNQNKDYEPLDGYYSEPYYQKNHVSEENDDERAMGPMYNNNNQYNYNKAPRPSQGQMQDSNRHISLNDSATGSLGDKIRNAIQKDSSLSNNAKAALVTADSNGQVTLSGSVATEAEKTKIESLAKSLGASKINNKITIQSHR